MDLRVGGKFKLIKKCGSGAFGEIYQGKSIMNSALKGNCNINQSYLTIFESYRIQRKNCRWCGNQTRKYIILLKETYRFHEMPIFMKQIFINFEFVYFRNQLRPNSLSYFTRQRYTRFWTVVLVSLLFTGSVLRVIIMLWLWIYLVQVLRTFSIIAKENSQ